ncbi:MAG: GIN domain-containing protein [Marinifilaceae bacterium]|jgi:hypothetical protein
MKLTYIHLLICLCLLSSCSPLQPFESPGKSTRKDIPLDENFNKLIISNIFDVELIPDTINQISFIGGENLLEKVNLTNHEESITISHDNKNLTRNFENIQVEIHYTNLNQVSLEYPCKLTGRFSNPDSDFNITIPVEGELVEIDLAIVAKNLKIHSYGTITAGIQLSGESSTASYVLNGIVNLKSLEFRCKKVNIVQNGIGEAHVWAEDNLDLTIYTDGNIYYKGNPEISTSRIQVNNQSPTAKVIKVD